LQPTSDYCVTHSSPQASHRDHPSGWQQAELLLGDFVRRSAPASKEGKTSARPRRRRTEQVPTCEELSLQCCSPQEQCSIANVATGMDVTTSATPAMVQMGVESSDELPPGGRVSITSLSSYGAGLICQKVYSVSDKSSGRGPSLSLGGNQGGGAAGYRCGGRESARAVKVRG